MCKFAGVNIGDRVTLTVEAPYFLVCDICDYREPGPVDRVGSYEGHIEENGILYDIVKAGKGCARCGYGKYLYIRCAEKITLNFSASLSLPENVKRKEKANV